jgi:hypothetical protein
MILNKNTIVITYFLLMRKKYMIQLKEHFDSNFRFYILHLDNDNI